MTERLYTIGEIFRGKMMLSPLSRKPYKDKASISRAIQRLPHTKIETPYGVGYAVTLSTIKAHNRKAKGTMRA